jgi:hypothetical protein
MSYVLACVPIQLPPVLYRELGGALVVLALLDILVTWTVLGIGGEELNLVARAVVEHAGLPGMVALKAAGILTVLVICEYIGRTRRALGRGVLTCAVVLNGLAVGLGTAVIGTYTVTLAFAL